MRSPPRHQHISTNLNRDGDSTLETKEVKGVMGPSAFKAAGADHDGTLSKDEYLALVAKLFKQADIDHDGSLTAAIIPFREWPSSEAAYQLTRAGELAQIDRIVAELLRRARTLVSDHPWLAAGSRTSGQPRSLAARTARRRESRSFKVSRSAPDGGRSAFGNPDHQAQHCHAAKRHYALRFSVTSSQTSPPRPARTALAE